MLTKLILMTPESFEKINQSKNATVYPEEPKDWYDIRQNIQQYLARKRKLERNESEAKKYKKNEIKSTGEIGIQTDPIEEKRIPKSTPRKQRNKKSSTIETQTENVFKLPPSDQNMEKRRLDNTTDDQDSDNPFRTGVEPQTVFKKMQKYYMDLNRKKSLRQEPKKRRLYQYGKYYNILCNWHCFE